MPNDLAQGTPSGARGPRCVGWIVPFRQDMLEALADFDDTLLEQLLEDSIPPKEEIYSHLQSDIGQDLVVPVI